MNFLKIIRVKIIIFFCSSAKGKRTLNQGQEWLVTLLYCVLHGVFVLMSHCRTKVFFVLVVGFNDAFVTIALGKEKYQTSVKEKAPANIEWHEECEL